MEISEKSCSYELKHLASEQYISCISEVISLLLQDLLLLIRLDIQRYLPYLAEEGQGPKPIGI